MRLRSLTAALIIPLALACTASAKPARVLDGCRSRGGLLLTGGLCTHGQDAPLVASSPVTSGCVVRGSILSLCDGKAKLFPSQSPTPSPLPSGTPGCGGGASRIQVLYLRQNTQPDTLTDRRSGIEQAAAQADAEVNDSAQVEGRTAHLRYLTDSACHLLISSVTTNRSLDSFDDQIQAVEDAGYTRADYTYLIFPETSAGCGIATLAFDSQPDPGLNKNNTGVHYASVSLDCRNGPTAAHELGHAMGAVQLDAPHSTGASHCNDALELMCYDDGGPSGAQHQACSSAWAYRYDCNRDDYFAFQPQGSYLPSHWNLIHSRWLDVS